MFNMVPPWDMEGISQEAWMEKRQKAYAEWEARNERIKFARRDMENRFNALLAEADQETLELWWFTLMSVDGADDPGDYTSHVYGQIDGAMRARGFLELRNLFSGNNEEQTWEDFLTEHIIEDDEDD